MSQWERMAYMNGGSCTPCNGLWLAMEDRFYIDSPRFGYWTVALTLCGGGSRGSPFPNQLPGKCGPGRGDCPHFHRGPQDFMTLEPISRKSARFHNPENYHNYTLCTCEYETFIVLSYLYYTDYNKYTYVPWYYTQKSYTFCYECNWIVNNITSQQCYTSHPIHSSLSHWCSAGVMTIVVARWMGQIRYTCYDTPLWCS